MKKGAVFLAFIFTLLTLVNVSAVEDTPTLEERVALLEQNTETQDQRISDLESWKAIATGQILEALNSITGLTTRVINLETTISTSCSQNCNEDETGAGTWGRFKKYISSSTKKRMVCDYATEERLEHVEDLGFICDITFTTLSTGKERVRCDCIKAQNSIIIPG